MITLRKNYTYIHYLIIKKGAHLTSPWALFCMYTPLI